MYLTGYSTPASYSSEWWHHFTYMFFHANIFHLAGNIYAMWIIRRFFTANNVISAYVISAVSSWATMVESIGSSGFVYALVGYSMVSTKTSRNYWLMFVLINLATYFFPNISFGIHITSFVLAAIYMKLRMFYNDYGR